MATQNYRSERTAELPTADEVLADQAASHWLKTALQSAMERDPTDAANDADILARIVECRCDAIVSDEPLQAPEGMNDDDAVDQYIRVEWLRSLRLAPRNSLVERVDQLTSENSALQLRSLSLMQQLQCLARELGMSDEEVQGSSGKASAKVVNLLEVLLPLAIETLRNHYLVDQSLARHAPAAAAALLAERRYHSRHSTSTWPASARTQHTRNFLVSAMEEGGVRPPASSDLPMWASAMESHSYDDFEVSARRTMAVDDGKEAARLGSIAGYAEHRGSARPQNPYAEGTFSHVVWKNAERRAAIRWDSDKWNADMQARQVAWLAKPPMLVKLEIVHTDPPAEEESNLPSHFFPGCSNGFVIFRVVEGTPDQEQIAAVVNGIEEDGHFSSYNPSTRTGNYSVIDGTSLLKVGEIITRWTRPPTEKQGEPKPASSHAGATIQSIPASQPSRVGLFHRLIAKFSFPNKDS
jgi:hypothetical protein